MIYQKHTNTTACHYHKGIANGLFAYVFGLNGLCISSCLLLELTLLALLSLSVSAQEPSAQQCIDCHAQQVAEWQQSHHSWSMREPSASSVLGDFNQANYTKGGISAEFYQQNGNYFVNLDEGNGRTTRWRIAYTFGVSPLQQYLIDIGDGALQALNLAWDTRPEEEGGQRWFRLDEGSHHAPGSALHWQGVYQNWNSQCASCHVTQLSKNYSFDQQRYTSEYVQINVACAACHGSASTHLKHQSQRLTDQAPA